MLIYSAAWALPYPSATLIYSFGLHSNIKISYFLKSSLAFFSSFFCQSLNKLRVCSFVVCCVSEKQIKYSCMHTRHEHTRAFVAVRVRTQQTDRKFILAVCTTITEPCQHEYNFNDQISRM